MQRLALPRYGVLLLSLLASAAVRAAPLDISAQQRIRAATFEVVSIEALGW